MKLLCTILFVFAATATTVAQPRPECAVEPLLKTIRVQTAPYNRSCPHYNYGDSVSSRPCLVGCVATALEQLLSYYRYPVALSDSIPGMETEHYSIPSVPSGSVIDWDDVADLSLWCGMIVDMKYGPDASSAGLWRAEEPLRRIFGYKTVRVLDRSLYSFDAWHRILQNELMAGRPVAYVGYNNMMGGHAFNIDGMDEDGLFHCNWGEGEHQNGYFSLEHLCQMQPHRDATDWGRMAGYHANEYMLLLHPDSVTDMLEPDTLKDFAHAVRVDDIVLRRRMTGREYVLTDVTLTNISEDTLYQTYEIILNLPSDTSLLDQCREVALSAVRLLPGETRTQAVAAHYPVTPGEWTVSLTFDGLEVPFSKRVQAESQVAEVLTFDNEGVVCGRDGTAEIVIASHNAMSAGASGRLLYYKLYREGSDISCSMDYRIQNLLPGESVRDTLRFHGLEPAATYVLHVGGWSGSLISATFTMPSEADGINDAGTEAARRQASDGMLYDAAGKAMRHPGTGLYIRDGKKVIYDGRRNH